MTRIPTTEPAEFETDDFEQDDTDQAPDLEETDKIPRQTPRAAAQVGSDTPSYLRELLGLPGVDPAALANVPTATAWAKIESDNGKTRQMPLAYLAPDALETLGNLGFACHTCFEIRAAQNGPVLCYFACWLPDLEEEEPDAAAAALGPEGIMAELLQRQQTQLSALETKLQAQAPGDPLAGLESALVLFERFSKIMQRIVPPVAAGGGNSDLGTIIDTVAKVAPLFMNRGEGAQEPQEPQP